MNCFRRLIPLLALLLTASSIFGAYEKVIIATPDATFEVQYPLKHPTQTLRVDTTYPYGGASGDFYFIRYSFGEGESHLVRVPRSNQGQALIQLEGNQVKVLRSFKYNFTKGSVLFDPRKDYTVLEKNSDTLVLQFNQTAGRITVPADKFKCKTSLRELLGTIDQQVAQAKGNLISDPTQLQAYLAANPASESLDPITNAVNGICVIENNTSAGTGFLFGIEGRVYCITNHHVLGSAKDLKISTSDGRTFTPIAAEIAQDRDLARILLKETPACFQALALPELNEAVRILGNSGGAGVITYDKGKVIGHAPKVIEVDANFISGNSGSPILNKDNQIIGVATYITAAEGGQDDWVAEKTRFAKARRFAVRITDDINWLTILPKRLAAGDVQIEQHAIFIQNTAELVLIFAADSTSTIPEDYATDLKLRSWVRQTNLMTQELHEQAKTLNPRNRTDYNKGLETLKVNYTNGFINQIRSLTHLVKRQRARLQTAKRSIPAAGYYTQQIENFDIQYTYLVEGLTFLSKYLTETTR